jgi:hypothetical protein
MNNSGNTITFTMADSTESFNIDYPNKQGDVGTIMMNDGSGTLTWQNPGNVPGVQVSSTSPFSLVGTSYVIQQTQTTQEFTLPDISVIGEKFTFLNQTSTICTVSSTEVGVSLNGGASPLSLTGLGLDKTVTIVAIDATNWAVSF